MIAPLEERWISYGGWLAEPRPGAPFRDPKRIIIRQTGDSIIAAIENEQRLTLNNIHNLRLKQNSPALEYLLAVLNSRLVTYFHQQAVPEAGRVFAEVKIVDLQQIPIRQIKFATPQAERKRLATKARLLFESGMSAKAAAILEFTAAELAADHTDVVHDFLVYLADQMTELNQAKHTTAKAFLEDLKDFHGIEARSLRPKTKLDEFWKLETADLFGHFHANKLSIKASDEDKIRSRFQQAKEKVVPFVSQLEFTDMLIDQIVYRLYGLTEDEMRIVNGAAK